LSYDHQPELSILKFGRQGVKLEGNPVVGYTGFRFFKNAPVLKRAQEKYLSFFVCRACNFPNL
jgi:hypothetical protein